MKDNISDQEVWLRAWVAYTSSSNSTKCLYASEWADSCLEDFKRRFPVYTKT